MISLKDPFLPEEYRYFQELADTINFIFSEVEDGASYDKKLKLYNALSFRNSKNLLMIKEILNRQLKSYETKKL